MEPSLNRPSPIYPEDYWEEMKRCALENTTESLELGRIYETQRNLKIEELGLKQETTVYFSTYSNGIDILRQMRRPSLHSQYPVAADVWYYLNSRGYSNDVIAGILGNMMAECGGQTLNLQPYLHVNGYYGLCMWSDKFCSEVTGVDLVHQIDYLCKTLKKNMTMFGGSYNDFLEMNYTDAANYFNQYYERSGDKSSVRVKNAKIAYEWITQEV